MTSPMTLAINGFLLSPIAVRIPVMIAFKKENRIKPQVIFKYTCAL